MIASKRSRHLHPSLTSVKTNITLLQGVSRNLAGQHGVELLHVLADIFRMRELMELAANEFLLAIAKNFCQLLVNHQQGAIGRHLAHTNRNLVERDAKT